MSNCLALVPSEPPRSELPPTNQQELCTKMMSLLFSVFAGRPEGNGNRANSGNWNTDLGCNLNVFDTPRQTRENVPPTDTPLTDKPTTGGSGGFGHENQTLVLQKSKWKHALAIWTKVPPESGKVAFQRSQQQLSHRQKRRSQQLRHRPKQRSHQVKHPQRPKHRPRQGYQ